MGRRLYPLAVTLTGGVGLGLALTFLLGVVLAFMPGWEDWGDFFVSWALYLVLIPYALLILNLVLRNHVGRFLLGRAAFEEAARYGGRRLKRSLVRSRREAANHRVVYARALVGLGRLDEARALLEEEHKKMPGSYAMEARRWLLEIALRQDDRRLAGALALNDPREAKAARGETAAVLACSAELALRQGDLEGYRAAIEEAMWVTAGHYRSRLTRALAMIKWEDDDLARGEAGEILERLHERVVREIPSRASELTALRALLLWHDGDQEKAAQELERARSMPTDIWSKRVIGEVEELVTPTV